MNDPIWVCRDGRRMLVKEMTNSHLANSIARIRRSPKGWRREWLPRLELEVLIRNMGMRY